MSIQTLDLSSVSGPNSGVAIITLTTDFGSDSRYVAQLKGVLLSRAPNVQLVGLSHTIAPQDIEAAARLLAESASWYPEGTVHLAVVDPEVGTDRPIVLVEAFGQRFVAPDNGLLGWISPEAITQMVSLDPARIIPAGESTTFHGRDLMAPAAALLSAGTRLEELGEPHADLVQLGAPKALSPALAVKQEALDSVDNFLTGQVVEIDTYGNLITNVSAEALAGVPHDETLTINCGEHVTYGLWLAYADQPSQTLIALIGSTAMMELAITNGNAADMLDAAIGEEVRIHWSS